MLLATPHFTFRQAIFEYKCTQHRCNRNHKDLPGALHIFQRRASFVPELFKMRRSKTGYFFKLGGKVCHTAVMHQISYFRKI